MELSQSISQVLPSKENYSGSKLPYYAMVLGIFLGG